MLMSSPVPAHTSRNRPFASCRKRRLVERDPRRPFWSKILVKTAVIVTSSNPTGFGDAGAVARATGAASLIARWQPLPTIAIAAARPTLYGDRRKVRLPASGTASNAVATFYYINSHQGPLVKEKKEPNRLARDTVAERERTIQENLAKRLRPDARDHAWETATMRSDLDLRRGP
jgi:hypothetical protein